MNRGSGATELIDEVRDRVPDGPGVYLFHGNRDEVLYVGKAINLRQRMLSHLRQDPKDDEPRHSRLIYEVRGFDYESTPAELLALLREDELIKKHRPRFNVRQNEFLEYKYIELTEDEYPRVRMIDHSTHFGNRRVFGPYRDRYLVDRILQLIHHSIGIRSCTDTDPGDGCLEFDLGQCAGPCRDGVTARDYLAVVARSTAFLDGDESEVASQLQMAMGRAAEKLDFEKAQRLKEQLEFCHRFGERQRFLRSFVERTLTVVEEGDPSLSYLFLRGWLVTHGTAEEVAAFLSSGTMERPGNSDDDPRFLLDRATVVHNWLRRNSNRCAYYFTDVGCPKHFTDSRAPSG